MTKDEIKLALEAVFIGFKAERFMTDADYTLQDKAVLVLQEALAQPQQKPEQQDPDWKDCLIAQHEETILWQAKRIAELLDASQPPAQQEPVAGVVLRDNVPTLLQDKHIKQTDERLYKSPQARRKPLTHQEISDIAINNSPIVHEFARAIEAAHDIKD